MKAWILFGLCSGCNGWALNSCQKSSGSSLSSSMIVWCKIIHDAIIFHRVSGFQCSAGSQTIPNHCWSTLNALSASFPADSWQVAKWDLFVTFWFVDSIHNCGPWRMDVIGKVVTHVVHIVIYNIVQVWLTQSTSLSKREEQWSTARMMVASKQCPRYWPCHATWQFFRVQCMQSMDPSIPGQPLSSFSTISLWVYSSLPRNPQGLWSIDLNNRCTESSHTLEDRSSPSEHRHGWHRRASISKNLHDCYYLQQWTCTFYPVAFLLNTNQGSCLSTAFSMVLKRVDAF